MRFVVVLLFVLGCFTSSSPPTTTPPSKPPPVVKSDDVLAKASQFAEQVSEPLAKVRALAEIAIAYGESGDAAAGGARFDKALASLTPEINSVVFETLAQACVALGDVSRGQRLEAVFREYARKDPEEYAGTLTIETLIAAGKDDEIAAAITATDEGDRHSMWVMYARSLRLRGRNNTAVMDKALADVRAMPPIERAASMTNVLRELVRSNHPEQAKVAIELRDLVLGYPAEKEYVQVLVLTAIAPHVPDGASVLAAAETVASRMEDSDLLGFFAVAHAALGHETVGRKYITELLTALVSKTSDDARSLGEAAALAELESDALNLVDELEDPTIRYRILVGIARGRFMKRDRIRGALL